MSNDAFFFGCGARAGHYWWAPGEYPRELYLDGVNEDRDGRPGDCPFTYEVDGGYQPGSPDRADRLRRRTRGEVQGEARLTHEKGWTALGWWDRSVDGRGGCCAVFALRGTHETEAMLAALRVHFPWVLDRQPVPVVVVERKVLG
jgi:hypothetical protein